MGEIADSIRANADSVEALEDLVAALEARLAECENPLPDPIPDPIPDPEPDPTPDPEPDPIPDPDPDPIPDPDPQPEPDDRPAALTRYLTPSMLVFHRYNSQGRYVRALPLYALKGQTTIKYNCMRAGGAGVNFAGMQCTLLCDGEPVAVDTPPADVSVSEFTLDVSTISEGWHVFDIESDNSSIRGVPYPMFVLHGDTVSIEQKWMPVVDGSHKHKMQGKHRIIWVPAKHDPTVLPFEKREYPAFDIMPTYNQAWKDWLIAPRYGGDQYETVIDQHGIINTMNLQRYKVWELHRKYPTHPIIDGPRGVGLVHLPTEIHIGTANIPEFGGIIHNTYVWHVHGFVKVKPDGSVHTLAGYRHHTPPHWEDPGMGDADEPHPFLELVGDWSEIPEERRGFHNIWGACLDSYSTRQDMDAPMVDLRGVMVHPHPEGTAWFCADTMNHRICKVQHSNKDHVTPPKVTEFITGLKGPFDCKEWGGRNGRLNDVNGTIGEPAKRGSLIVSEREANRISEYDMETGELIRHIVEGGLGPLAYVNAFRMVKRTASLDVIRSQDVVCPDGIDVIDDWLYYASAAMGQIKRVHLVTGEIQTPVPAFPGDGAGAGGIWYLKINVSDGTAGPKHTIYTMNWSASRFGGPVVHVPDGDADVAGTWTDIGPLITGGSAEVSRGTGRYIDDLGYSTGVAAKNGRIVWGGVSVGLMQLSLSLPDDPRADMNLTEQSNEKKKFYAARAIWNDKGYDLRYGDNGMGHYGEPVPWHDEDIRPYLEWFGHKENA